MPLIVDGGRIPTHWAERKRSQPTVSAGLGVGAKYIKIALINNMPDPALEDTELQFFELLDAASGDLPVLLKLYSLAGVPRTDRGTPHLNKFYFDVDDLWNERFDGLIMTGTEPHHPNLRQEPYWLGMVNVLQWAEENTTSTVLSCLAAHAGVLYSDGIERHRLADKQFGVFEFAKPSDHPLTRGTAQTVHFPHSRWNEVRADDLVSSGYTILSQSVEAGVDTFVKRKRKSLFVHFQGHPEYGQHTLLKEYRRDIKRFLRRERETYPLMPHGYFDAYSTELLSAFQDAALARRQEEIMAKFPEEVVDSVQKTWDSSALSIYRNWLCYIESTKREVAAFPAMAQTYQGTQRKRSAMR